MDVPPPFLPAKPARSLLSCARSSPVAYLAESPAAEPSHEPPRHLLPSRARRRHSTTAAGAICAPNWPSEPLLSWTSTRPGASPRRAQILAKLRKPRALKAREISGHDSGRAAPCHAASLPLGL
uniref:Uncharacterized protein n=1 Tax=Arundo donax TaxID=35708 RepID=A0A0A9BB70_ARUDO